MQVSPWFVTGNTEKKIRGSFTFDMCETEKLHDLKINCFTYGVLSPIPGVPFPCRNISTYFGKPYSFRIERVKLIFHEFN